MDDPLVSSLRAQRAELDRVLTRVPQLSGPAREDVFLRVRRLLAVLVTVERILSAGRWEPPRELEDEVAEAERLDHASPAFVRAARRVAALRGASAPPERDVSALVERLPEADRARVAAGVRLAEGEGETYVGNAYADMLAAVEAQLSEPASLQHPG